MFKLVGIQDSLFAVQDTDDGVIDILPRDKVCKCLNLGLSVGGITRVSDSEFDYTDEFFLNEPEDDYSDEDYSDEGFDDSEGDYSEEDYEEDYSEEDYEEDYSEDFDDSEGDYSDEEEYEDYDSYEDYEDLEDYEDYTEASTVNRLYSFLNEEQIKLLKRYYLWYSQRIFDEGSKKQRTMRITNSPRMLQKQKDLDVIRNQGGMWAYAGFIDMGYRGADYCTLGHPLRYVHIAWDVSVSDIEKSFFGDDYDNNVEDILSSNNCIKFGIDCISDFFEIDKEYTDKLRKAQREAIKDMDFMCKYYEEGTSSAVISSFTVMDEIINNVALADSKGFLLQGDAYKCLVPKSLTSFYRQFRKLGVVVPKSLVQEIRDNLVGWSEHKFIGWKYPNWSVVGNVISSIFGKKSYDFVSSLSKRTWGYGETVKDYLTVFFQLKSCGYYEYNADTFKDEGGASKKVKSQLYMVYKSVRKDFWSDKEFTFSFIKKLIEVNELLTELQEVRNKFKTPIDGYDSDTGKHYVDFNNIGFNSVYMEQFGKTRGIDLKELVGILGGKLSSSNRICKIDYNNCYSISEFIDTASNKLNEAQSVVEDYRSFVIDDIQRRVDSLNNDSNSTQESKPVELSDEEVIKYCSENLDKVKNKSELSFPMSVLNTVSKTGKCSDKQMYYIGKIYTELTGVQIEDKRKSSKVNLDDRKDIESAIDKVLASSDLLTDERTRSILSSIKKYRSISEKQMKYAEMALEAVSK